MRIASVIQKHALSCERRLLFKKRQTVLERIDTQDNSAAGKQNSSIAGSKDIALCNRIASLQLAYVTFAWISKGRKLNLHSPETLAEKIEWLKFNYHKSLLIQLTDKLAVRKYVVQKISTSRVLTRIYGCYDSTADIPLEVLPQNYVLKTNRWSGDVTIKFDDEPVEPKSLKKLDKRLSRIYGTKNGEWPYWHIKPRVYVEEYLEDQFGQLVDYKFFCFNGIPKLVRVGKDKHIGAQQVSYFDENWKIMPFRDAKAPPLKEGQKFPCPDSFGDMLLFASQLSKNLPLVRLDFYDVFGQCKFGEITLFHEGGIGCIFYPDSWNYTIGEWLELPQACPNPKLAYGVGETFHHAASVDEM